MSKLCILQGEEGKFLIPTLRLSFVLSLYASKRNLSIFIRTYSSDRVLIMESESFVTLRHFSDRRKHMKYSRRIKKASPVTFIINSFQILSAYSKVGEISV